MCMTLYLLMLKRIFLFIAHASSFERSFWISSQSLLLLHDLGSVPGQPFAGAEPKRGNGKDQWRIPVLVANHPFPFSTCQISPPTDLCQHLSASMEVRVFSTGPHVAISHVNWHPCGTGSLSSTSIGKTNIPAAQRPVSTGLLDMLVPHSSKWAYSVHSLICSCSPVYRYIEAEVL